jgi:hypothetical protein
MERRGDLGRQSNLYLPPEPRTAAKLTMAAGPVQVVVEGQSDSVRAEAEEALVADDPRHRVGGELHTLPAHLACRHR